MINTHKYIKYKLANMKIQQGGNLTNNLPVDFNINFPQGALNDIENVNIINEILSFLKGKTANTITILSISSGNARTEALLIKALHQEPITRTKNINLILYDILYDNPNFYNKIFNLYKYDFKPQNLRLYNNIANLQQEPELRNITIIIGFNIQQINFPGMNPELTNFKSLCKLLLENNSLDITTPIFIYNKYAQNNIRRLDKYNINEFCGEYLLKK